MPVTPEKRRARGSYIVRLDDKTAFVRRPIGSRVVFGLAGTIVAMMDCGLIALLVPGAMGPRRLDGAETAIILVPIIFLLSVSLLLLAFGGPSEMRLDWAERRYTYRRGLPMFAWQSSGPFADFEYLYQTVHIVGSYAGATAQNLVYLRWKQSPRILGIIREWDFIVESADTPEAAREVAQSIGARIGIPAERKRRGTPSFWRKYFFDF